MTTMTAHSATCKTCAACYNGFQCRRHAPVVVAISTYEYGEPVVAPVTVFPDVAPDDWCAEHLAAMRRSNHSEGEGE